MADLANSLKPGDEVRIISPSDVPKEDSQEISKIIAAFHKLGLTVSFSDNCFNSKASIKDKLDDLHTAFRDPSVKAVFASTGGFSSNNLIDGIDFKLIKKHPKIICGYSDITVLLNAIYSRTGLITYHGPNASGAANEHGHSYTQEYLKKCLFSREVFTIEPSSRWFNKDYSVVSPRYTSYKNDGWWDLNKKGIVEGRLIGGNLSCLLLLAGTNYFPNLKKAIVFIEDDFETQKHHFEAKFRSLTQQPGFNKIEGLIFGRSQPKSDISKDNLSNLLTQYPSLRDVPVLANVDFGHTKPQATIPVGGIAQLKVLPEYSEIKIIEH